MTGFSFSTLYEHEQFVTMAILVVYAVLLIIQVIFAGKYLRKRLGKRRGAMPLTLYTVLLVAIVLGCGLVADRLPVRFGQRDTTVWYSLFTTIVVFFLLYILVWLFTLILGWIIRHWRNWRRKRRKKVRYIERRDL